jgi:transcriptional regulator with XRE-family HTH domain
MPTSIGGVVRTNVRRLRNQLNLSQAALGERIGVRGSEISKVETGRQEPRYALLEKIAAGLEVPVAALFIPHDISAEDLLQMLVPHICCKQKS